MKPILPLLAALAAITAPLQADVIVESNLTIALKFYYNDAPEVETPKFTTRKYATASIKNSDIISAYARANGGTFSKKAKLIKVEVCDNESHGDVISTKYIIRDNGVDTDITSMFNIDSEGNVRTYKLNNEEGTETRSILSILTFEFATGDQWDDESISASGMDKITRKIIKYQGQFATLRSSSAVLSGFTQFQSTQNEVPMSGLIQGTFKLSAPKAVSLVD